MTTKALLFPGQGSQKIGMLANLLAKDQEFVRQKLSEANTALGFDLESVTNDARINETQYTQPALLFYGLVSWSLSGYKLEDFACCAGHSLGEFTALAVSGAISFVDALKIVQRRGEIMQSAVPAGVGAMAAIIGLDIEAITAVCAKFSTTEHYVGPANLNAKLQTVIAGDKAAVEQCCAALKDQGAKRAMLLPVSVPSHTPLLQEAAALFAQELQKYNWQQPRIPVLQNVSGTENIEVEKILEDLAKQMYSPVQWSVCTNNMVNLGIKKFYEVGPGQVLTNLMKREVPAVECLQLHKA